MLTHFNVYGMLTHFYVYGMLTHFYVYGMLTHFNVYVNAEESYIMVNCNYVIEPIKLTHRCMMLDRLIGTVMIYIIKQ